MDREDRKVRTLRMLLADDDPDLRALLAQALRKYPFEFEIARCGEGGGGPFSAAHLRHKRFDLVVLDVSMPDKDGFAVTREIRKTDSTVPIVFLSGIDDPQGAYEAEQIGALDYLQKPDGLLQLVPLICHHFGLGTEEEPCGKAADAF